MLHLLGIKIKVEYLYIVNNVKITSEPIALTLSAGCPFDDTFRHKKFSWSELKQMFTGTEIEMKYDGKFNQDVQEQKFKVHFNNGSVMVAELETHGYNSNHEIFYTSKILIYEFKA